MTQLSLDPGYQYIEDALDAVGQKYRVQRIVRGAMLFCVGALCATIAASLVVDAVGQGKLAVGIAVAWIGWLLATAMLWLVHPLIIRPKTVAVARLVESKISGLHNGLTNSILLAHARDIATSPWLPQIFAEVADASRKARLGDAVRMADLKPLAYRLGMVSAPFLAAAFFLRPQMSHGWQQMFNPMAFVPRMGAASILSVDPGDVTLVAGQPLEIGVVARAADPADATLFFEPVAGAIAGAPSSADASASGEGSASSDAALPPQASLTPTIQPDDATVHYGYRAEHVDTSVRYRVDIAGTQSQWYTVTVVNQVKLTTLTLSVHPPVYTGQKPQQLVIGAADVDKTPITVPQGSEVELEAAIDTPTSGAMLQLGDAPPAPMAAVTPTRYSQKLIVTDDVSLQVLPTEAGQVLTKLPDSPLTIHCTKDNPPVIEMHWPKEDTTAPPAGASGDGASPDGALKISATLHDDYGVVSYRISTAPTADAPLTPVADVTLPQPAAQVDVNDALSLPADQQANGKSIFVQVECTDNRDLASVMKDGGPQTTQGPRLQITFQDPKQIAADQKEQQDKLRQLLMQMLQRQKALHDQTIAWQAGDSASMTTIHTGQSDLRTLMQTTATTFTFDDQTQIIQKTLLILVGDPAKSAEDISAAILIEPQQDEQKKESADLQTQQRHIIATLESLLALLNASPDPTKQPTTRESDVMPANPDALSKLSDSLKAYMKEQRRILDQTAELTKKPVDDLDDNDKKKLDQLKMSQDKLDAFMQQAISDFSKNAEQDMSNPALLKDLMQLYSEVTMVQDAQTQKSTEIAVPLEESGLENAKELDSNIERWLGNTPDRQAWKMEDPTAKNDTPMPELPTELEDMIGQLMEQQEDLMQDAEDANANWQDSMNKGVGWDAADGPIADMSAKGVTGNVLPNNNEMQGRSGEGRSGKSQGEFVGDTAVGKGGRNTPTRLDPTAFQQGQIKDTSKDPVGGATGGGKISGEGAGGLEGPVPPQTSQEMQRLASKQAEIRNKAERLNLQYQLGNYDNFKMAQAIELMRRMQSDFEANRYQNAMRDRDVLLDDMADSKMLLGGRISVQQDTTPPADQKQQQDIDDAMKGDLPAAWSDALKQYYQKLSQE